MNILLALLAVIGSFKIGDCTITWNKPAGGDGTENVGEDTPVGATSVTFDATSDDTLGDISLVSTGTPFTVGTGGLLSITSLLDFETLATYTIEIQAVDASTTSTATVTISVTDANDAPVCVQDQYVGTVSDGSTEGKAVITVSATDQDSADTLTWTISGSDFSIASATGALTVATGKTLDASTTGGYQLTATVSDSTASDTCTVWVAVTDCSSGSTAVLTSVFTVFVAFLASLN